MHKKIISGSVDTGRDIIAGQTGDKIERPTYGKRVLFTDTLQILVC